MHVRYHSHAVFGLVFGFGCWEEARHQSLASIIQKRWWWRHSGGKILYRSSAWPAFSGLAYGDVEFRRNKQFLWQLSCNIEEGGGGCGQSITDVQLWEREQ